VVKPDRVLSRSGQGRSPRAGYSPLRSAAIVRSGTPVAPAGA
jgi:hypothetical protein